MTDRASKAPAVEQLRSLGARARFSSADAAAFAALLDGVAAVIERDVRRQAGLRRAIPEAQATAERELVRARLAAMRALDPSVSPGSVRTRERIAARLGFPVDRVRRYLREIAREERSAHP